MRTSHARNTAASALFFTGTNAAQQSPYAVEERGERPDGAHQCAMFARGTGRERASARCWVCGVGDKINRRLCAAFQRLLPRGLHFAQRTRTCTAQGCIERASARARAFATYSCMNARARASAMRRQARGTQASNGGRRGGGLAEDVIFCDSARARHAHPRPCRTPQGQLGANSPQ